MTEITCSELARFDSGGGLGSVGGASAGNAPELSRGSYGGERATEASRELRCYSIYLVCKSNNSCQPFDFKTSDSKHIGIHSFTYMHDVVIAL